MDALPTNSVTEWEEVNRAVTPLLVGQGDNGYNLLPAALNANDIQFIATKTSLAIVLIQSWSAAQSIQQSAIALLAADHPTETAIVTKLGWPLFYGLCRQLSVSTLQGLYSRTVGTLTNSIKTAQQQRQIPTVPQEDAGAFCNTIELLRQLQQIQPDAVNRHPIAQVTSLLDISLSTKIKLAALGVMEQVGSNKPDALLSLHKDFPNDSQEINRFIQGIRLHQLANGNATLIHALDSHVSNDGDSIASLADLAVSDWSNIATQSNVDTPAAMAMLNSVELAHPVEAFQSPSRTKSCRIYLERSPRALESYSMTIRKGARLHARTYSCSNTIEDAAERTLNSIGLLRATGVAV